MRDAGILFHKEVGFILPLTDVDFIVVVIQEIVAVKPWDVQGNVSADIDEAHLPAVHDTHKTLGNNLRLNLHCPSTSNIR